MGTTMKPATATETTMAASTFRPWNQMTSFRYTGWKTTTRTIAQAMPGRNGRKIRYMRYRLSANSARNIARTEVSLFMREPSGAGPKDRSLEGARRRTRGFGRAGRGEGHHVQPVVL